MNYTSADCRVCLENDGVWPIFGDELKPDISSEITEFGTIRLRHDDDLPKHICENCFMQLQGAVSFRRTAKRTDLLLRKGNVKNISGGYFSLESETQHSNFNEYRDGKLKSELAPDNAVEGLLPVKDELLTDESHERSKFINNNCSNDHSSDIDQNLSESKMLVSSNEKKLNKETFTCKCCNMDLDSQTAYEEHNNSNDHKRNYVISFLPKKKRKTVTKEMKTVNPKDSKCDICNKFFTKLHFPRHMQTEHNIILNTSQSTNKQECPICKEMFHPISLASHMKKVHREANKLPPKGKLECPICKKLISKRFYPLHVQRHKEGDTKNYVCDQCGKKFFFESSFRTHGLIHTNDLPHKCEYCPYRGRTKDLLKIHVRTHTGDYPYKCTQCDTRCLTKSNLNSHMRRHRGPIDFICHTCSRGFYSKVELERHITVSHYGVKSYSCSICGVAFGYKRSLTKHQRKLHKRPKGLGKAKAVYLQLEEEGLLQPRQEPTDA